MRWICESRIHLANLYENIQTVHQILDAVSDILFVVPLHVFAIVQVYKMIGHRYAYQKANNNGSRKPS